MNFQVEYDPSNHENHIDSCDPGWTGHGGFCYSNSLQKLNWEDSLKNCRKSPGADLVSIHSEKDKKFIASGTMGDTWVIFLLSVIRQKISVP